MSEIEQRRQFNELASDLRPDLYRYAFWLCRNPQLADDVVQEALLRAWKARDQLTDRSAAKSWLITIVRREHARHYERSQLDTVDIADVEDALAATEGREEVEDMRRAIFELADDYREPLVLQVLLGYSTEEIAGLMEIKQGAVLTRLHRARAKLKETFASPQAGGAG